MLLWTKTGDQFFAVFVLFDFFFRWYIYAITVQRICVAKLFSLFSLSVWIWLFFFSVILLCLLLVLQWGTPLNISKSEFVNQCRGVWIKERCTLHSYTKYTCIIHITSWKWRGMWQVDYQNNFQCIKTKQKLMMVIRRNSQYVLNMHLYLTKTDKSDYIFSLFLKQASKVKTLVSEHTSRFVNRHFFVFLYNLLLHFIFIKIYLHLIYLCCRK